MHTFSFRKFFFVKMCKNRKIFFIKICKNRKIFSLENLLWHPRTP